MHESCRARAERILGDLVETSRVVLCLQRLELLFLLAAGPCDVGGIADALNLGITVISGHLTKLARSNLVLCEAVGRTRRYSLASRVRFESDVDRIILVRFDLGFRAGFDLRVPCELAEQVGWRIIEYPPSLPILPPMIDPSQPVILQKFRISEVKSTSLHSQMDDGLASYPPPD